MLHILWMLIKFILIVLGILLGLVLLAILLLLFDPVRYRVQAEKDGEGLGAVTAKARVSWLFGLIALRVSYMEGKPVIDVRIFGIPLGKITGRKRRKKKAPSSHKKSKAAALSETASPKRENSQKKKPSASPAKEDSWREKPSASPEKETSPGEISAAPARSEASPGEIPAVPAQNEDFQEDAPSAPGLFSRIWGMLKTILGLPFRAVKFLFALPGKIAAAVRKIWVTIGNICDKIGWWRDFLQDEQTKAAILLVKRQAAGLIRHILPTKVSGDVTFGCADPSLTGRILAVLGMSFPLHKNRIAVRPLFDGENHLIGRVALKGRIYGIVILAAVLKILMNKNIKYVISRWKSKA